jgi:hypothetical protein
VGVHLGDATQTWSVAEDGVELRASVLNATGWSAVITR